MARQRGFTLIEIIVVLVLMGIVFGIAIPKIENLSPKYALRAAAREIASQLEYVRASAVNRRKTFAVVYALEARKYTIVTPPPEGQSDLPFEDWPRLEPASLPTLVSFHSIIRADNYVFQVGDVPEVPILIDPLGASGSHVVVLKDSLGHVISVKFNALLGTVDFYNDVVGFAQF